LPAASKAVRAIRSTSATEYSHRSLALSGVRVLAPK